MIGCSNYNIFDATQPAIQWQKAMVHRVGNKDTYDNYTLRWLPMLWCCTTEERKYHWWGVPVYRHAGLIYWTPCAIMICEQNILYKCTVSLIYYLSGIHGASAHKNGCIAVQCNLLTLCNIQLLQLMAISTMTSIYFVVSMFTLLLCWCSSNKQSTLSLPDIQRHWLT